MFDTPANCLMAIFAGMHINNVTPIPISPAVNPIISVSALNTLDMSFFDAPIALSIPISFTLSSTDMYVIIPIIIDDTISDTLTNAIST